MAPKKDKKVQKMQLGEFLTDPTLGSWADEMEDMPVPSSGNRPYGQDRSFGGSSGGYSRNEGGAKDDRGYSIRPELPMPSAPPYTVHLGNMPFDATEGDVHDFFLDCAVKSVRIVEDKLERKPKGFAYVEFGTLEGLKKALEANGTQFHGRNIRISIAEAQKGREETRDFSDWSRKGPLPDVESNQGGRRPSDRGGYSSNKMGMGGLEERGERNFNRSFDNMSEAGSERASRRPGGYNEQGDGKVRDFSNWERKGPLTPTIPNAGMGRPVSRDGPRDGRKNSPAPAWGEGRSQEGSRPPRREFADRPAIERAPTAAEMDSQWRTKMRPDPPVAKTPTLSPSPSHKGISTPASPASGPKATLAEPRDPNPTSAPPTTRPKLNLAKRTVSTADHSTSASSQPSAATAADAPKSSPFGAAKPIDTFAREQEIEEKREATAKAKKEAEEKAKEQKKAEKAAEKAVEDKARDERTAKGEKNGPPSLTSERKVNGQKATNGNAGGESSPVPGKKFEILRRVTAPNGEESTLDGSNGDDVGEEDGAAAAEEDDADADGLGSANGMVVDDKAVKPQELVRDVGAPAGKGSTAEAMAADGWATVVSGKGGKKGRGGARALAS